MGKRRHRDPAEREAREARRAERADRSIHRKVDEIAAAEYAARLHHALNMAGIADEDLVSLNAEGFVGKRVHVTGTPENWRCPTCEGQGYFGESDDEDDCWDCGGTGFVNSVTPPNEDGNHDSTTTTG
jgi:hypothetical protein